MASFDDSLSSRYVLSADVPRFICFIYCGVLFSLMAVDLRDSESLATGVPMSWLGLSASNA